MPSKRLSHRWFVRLSFCSPPRVADNTASSRRRTRMKTAPRSRTTAARTNGGDGNSRPSMVQDQPNRIGQRQILVIQDGHPERRPNGATNIWPRIRSTGIAVHTGDRAMQLGHTDAGNRHDAAAHRGRASVRAIRCRPAQMLAPLTSRPTNSNDYLATHPVRLIHGPMLGCNDRYSVRIWVRTADESRRRGSHLQARSRIERRAGRDRFDSHNEVYGLHGVSRRPPDLEPDTAYWYDVRIDNKPVLGKTLPIVSHVPAPRFAGQISASLRRLRRPTSPKTNACGIQSRRSTRWPC